MMTGERHTSGRICHLVTLLSVVYHLHLMKYVLITPAHNEERFIAKTLDVNDRADGVTRAMGHC